MQFRDYIKLYFIEEKVLKENLKLNNKEFLHYQTGGVIPKCSYNVINENLVNTYIFGDLKIKNGIIGKYYSKSVSNWYFREKNLLKTKNLLEMVNHLKTNFISKYTSNLMKINLLNELFPELFDKKSELIIKKLIEKAEQTWDHHIHGTYGLCVKDPSTITDIIQKQIAVTKLIKITNNGKKYCFNDEEKKNFFKAETFFNEVASPFSEAEYPISSRKRLIDDIKQRINNE